MDRPDIAGYLRAGWGLDATAVRYLPVGHDSLASAYEVRAGGSRYFVKLTRRPIGAAAVLLPVYLHGQGLTQVVASLPTGGGEPWYRAGDALVLLYPFVDGVPPAGPLTPEQWAAYGGFLGALHATALPERVAALVPEEAYDSPGSVWLRELAGDARAGHGGGRWATTLSDFWLPRETEIAELTDRADRLGRLARQQGRPHVLCHADIHTNNILVDGAGRLHVVDWDAPVRAPRERDLMFVTWALTGPGDEQAFRSGYGRLDLDPVVLAYYRYERLVADLAEFADVVLRRDDVDDAARQREYEIFVRQFGPGGAVEQARTLDGRLR